MKAGIDFTGITTPFYCVDENGYLLLHKRSSQCRDEHGVWDPGGGKLEFGYTLGDNVLREVKEEYGCNGKIIEQLPAFAHTREHEGVETHWLAIPFIIGVRRNDVVNNEPHKIDEIRWFTLSTLPDPIHTGMKFMMREHSDHLQKYIHE